MKINYFFLFIFLLSIFSCQTAKKAEDSEENQAEKLAQQIQHQKQDSLQTAFCECLVKDSLSNQQRLSIIDNFIAQKIDINLPCSFEEEVVSGSAETALINMGVAISNRILRTKFRKRTSKVNSITKVYPILMLFSEDTSMINELVNRGANLDTKIKDVVSLPEYYVSQNNLENLQFVLGRGVNTEEINITTNNEKIIDFLIEKGAKTENIDKQTLFKEENYKQLAKKYKIDISKMTCDEVNNLSRANQFRKINFERTAWLLENGISIDCIQGDFLEDVIEEHFDNQSFDSKSQKQITSSTRNEWIALLGKYNVNWNQCASFGKSPLMLAIEKHNKELIQLLLNQNADIEFTCEFAGQKKTPLTILENEMKYVIENEQHKKERKKEKYSKKDMENYNKYLSNLNEIKELLKK